MLTTFQRTTTPKKLLPAFLALNLALHWAAQLPWINESAWFWRAAHTLLVTFWFKQDGISLWNYQFPLFGPPWQVPFEFPLYQAACAALSNLLSIDIVTASHITSLLIFDISAIFVYLICREVFESRLAGGVIFAVYLWMPYNFNYSKEILIDFTALMFALGAIYLAMRWFARPARIWAGVLAGVFLALGGMVKVTTMPVVIFPFLFLLLRSLGLQGFKPRFLAHPAELAGFVRGHRAYVAVLVLMAALPLAGIWAWTGHADSIKAANVHTTWLTSAGQREWNFGTWEQKLSLSNWRDYFDNMRRYFFRGGIFALPLIAWLGLLKASGQVKAALLSALLGPLLTIFIFFGLYFHEYYYIAISACISVLIGSGLVTLLQFLMRRRKAWLNLLVGAVLAGFVLVPGYNTFVTFRAYIDQEHQSTEAVYVDFGRKVRAITPANAQVIILQKNWEPNLVWEAERKALLLTYYNTYLFNCEMTRAANYTTVVDTFGSKDLERVLACFEGYEQSYPGVYRVWR